MKKIVRCLSLCVVLTQVAGTIHAQDWQAQDYTLSMAGALINEHCGRVWQNGEYVNIHACNYNLANLFTIDLSARHFEECTVLAQGDIVKIADCMVERFNGWLAQQSQ